MTIKTTYEITADDVRYGDTIITGPTRTGNGLKVKAIKDGEKWITFTFANPEGADLKTKWLREAEVTVLREEQTPEEIEESKRLTLFVTLRKNVESGIVDRAREILDEAIAKHDASVAKGYAGSPYITNWNLSEIIEAQSVRSVYLRISDSFEALKSEGLVDDQTALFAAYGWVIQRDFDRQRSPWNRSTSVASNLIEDTDAWAFRKILTESRGWGQSNWVASVFQSALQTVEAARDAQRVAAASTDSSKVA